MAQVRSIEERFWEKVQKTDTCWLWTAAKTPHGYGVLGTQRKRVDYAHRISYELAKGPIPEGLELDHVCCRPQCVNPDHLEAVTHHENTLRGISPAAFNARKLWCKRGHEFTAENTYVKTRGTRFKRECRICMRAAQQRRKERNRK